MLTGLHRLYARLPEPPDVFEEKPLDEALAQQQLTPPLEWEVTVTPDAWQVCMAYGERLRHWCDPEQVHELDEQLRPVYGRLHVQALKIALLLAALHWIDTDTDKPTVTLKEWHIVEILAEYLRASAHELGSLLERSGEASREQRLQERMLALFTAGGTMGRPLRDVYRLLHLTAKPARQMADDLVLAGLHVKSPVDGAEGYIARLSHEFQPVSQCHNFHF